MTDTLETIASFSNQGIRTDLKISEDQHKAFIYSEHETSSTQTVNVNWEMFITETCNWLESHILLNFIDDRALKDAFTKIKEGVVKVNRKIAQGIKPGEPRDGKLVLLVKPFNNSHKSSYSVKDKFQNNFDNIRKGNFIFRLYQPKEGAPGTTVTGEHIPPLPGQPVEITLGEGVELLSPDGSFSNARATRDGYVQYESGIISIMDTLIIDSDIDHKSGSISFVGSIVVKGSVKKGFSVQAEKELSIEGDCHNSTLISNEKSISLKGKILGEDIIKHFSPETLESDSLIKIQAKENIHAEGIQSQAIFTYGTITINEHASRCLLSSANSVYIGQSLYAARVRTVCGIEVGTLGNQSGASNLIELLSPEEASREYMLLLEKKLMINQQQQLLSVFLGPYLENPASLKRLQAAHREKIELSLKKLLELNKQSEKIDALISSTKEDSSKSLSSRVNIREKAFPGTKITGGDQHYYFSEEAKGPFSILYDFRKNTFTKTDIAPLECIFEETTHDKKA
jgi:uncharacterized protein